MTTMKLKLTLDDRSVEASQDCDDGTVDTLLGLLEAVYLGAGFVNDLDIAIHGSVIGPENVYIRGPKG